jgi:hypothetical protein
MKPTSSGSAPRDESPVGRDSGTREAGEAEVGHGARVHGADRRAEGRHRRSQLKEIHNTGWGRGSGRREGKLTRRCRRHRSARSRCHRPSRRPPRPNLPDTSKHTSPLAIFTRRHRARRSHREKRRYLDAGGQAHRRRLRALAPG